MLIISHATSCGGLMFMIWVFCQHNFSQIAKQNFVKLCSNEDVHINIYITFTCELGPFFNLEHINETSSQLVLTAQQNFAKMWLMRIFCVDDHFYRKVWFDFLLQNFGQIYYFVQSVLQECCSTSYLFDCEPCNVTQMWQLFRD